MNTQQSFVQTFLHCLIESIRAGIIITLLLTSSVLWLSSQSHSQQGEDSAPVNEPLATSH